MKTQPCGGSGPTDDWFILISMIRIFDIFSAFQAELCVTSLSQRH